MAVLAVVVVGGAASPAAAHATDSGSLVADDYAYRIDAFDPGVAGVELTHVDAVGQLELVNRSDVEVTVLGYAEEPYLRVGPDGVWRNERSPSTYLDADPSGQAQVPPGAEAEAAPEWVELSEGTSTRWHDHRSHWMGGTPTIDASSGPVEIAEWTIPILVGDERVEAVGTTLWAPGPDPWPWIAGALVLAVAIAVVGLTRRWWWWAMAVGAAVVLAATGLDVVGTWWALPGGVLDKAPTVAAVLLVALCPMAGLLLVPNDRRAGAVLVGVGSLVLLALVGWSGLAYLDRSQLPTGLDDDLARAAVAAVLGGATGLLVVALRTGLAGPGLRRSGRAAS